MRFRRDGFDQPHRFYGLRRAERLSSRRKSYHHSDGNCIIETAAKSCDRMFGSVLPQDDSVTEIGTWRLEIIPV
ncbi:MAG: hypothetical protein ACLRSW_04820 [Christensenellaceae bacterium]